MTEEFVSKSITEYDRLATKNEDDKLAMKQQEEEKAKKQPLTEEEEKKMRGKLEKMKRFRNNLLKGN